VNPDRPASRNRRRLVLLGLACVFLVPLAAAFVLYYGTGLRPATTAAHGDLLPAPVSLPRVALVGQAGESLPPTLLANTWSLVYLAGNECSAACRTRLDELRRVRLALAADAPRVQRVLLYARSCCATAIAVGTDLSTAYAGESGRPLLASFGPAANSEGSVYLVDPHGNLFMRYAPTVPARGMLIDLQRLLRLSHIG
jgi:hypothetical protein